jgi:uncharacterized protein YggE
MKKILFVIIACFLLFSWAHAADLSQPHITVYGEAEEKVTPDRMVWYLNVTNKSASLQEVAEAHTRIVGEILGYLKQADIPEEDIQTSRMRFGENWVYRNSARVKEGYFAATQIMFRLADLDRYDDFWMKLSKYDHVNINTVNFEISDDTKYLATLRDSALLAAREKAQRMAGVLDAGIGEPLVIEEEPPASGVRYESARMLASSDDGDLGSGQTAIAPGLITLQTRVTVVYRLINVQ